MGVVIQSGHLEKAPRRSRAVVVESPGDWTCLGDGPEGQAERVGSGRAFQARDPQDQRQFSSLGTEAP